MQKENRRKCFGKFNEYGSQEHCQYCNNSIKFYCSKNGNPDTAWQEYLLTKKIKQEVEQEKKAEREKEKEKTPEQKKKPENKFGTKGVYVIKDGKRFYDKETRKKQREHFFLLDAEELLFGSYLKLPNDEILVHLAISSFYDADKAAVLRVETIADAVRMKPDRVYKAIQNLEKKGIIEIEDKTKKRKRSVMPLKNHERTFLFQEKLMFNTNFKTGVKFMKKELTQVEPLSKNARRVFIVLRAITKEMNDKFWIEHDEWLYKEYDEVYYKKDIVRDILDISRPVYSRCIDELIGAELIEPINKFPKTSIYDAYKVFR